MEFADSYLDQIEALAEWMRLPRVRALHLPPQPAHRDNLGEFCALELDDGAIGLSYVLFDDTLARLRAEHADERLAGADALVLARQYAHGQGAARTIGFAAANALSQSLFRRTGFEPPASTDSIGGLDPQPGEHIGMIGLFPPLIGAVTRTGARLTVVELNPSLAADHPGYRVTLDPQALRSCDKVLSTSTLLLNDTLDRMLALCRQARAFAMIGPGAGGLPDALFARGVTFVGGSQVVDAPAFLDALKSGHKRGSATRKYGLTPANYPGFAALLARL